MTWIALMRRYQTEWNGESHLQEPTDLGGARRGLDAAAAILRCEPRGLLR